MINKFLVLQLLCHTSLTFAQHCENKELSIIYLNGVLTNLKDAEDTTTEIYGVAHKNARKVANRFSEDNICYQTAHNVSHGLNDALEVIGQKFREELGADFKWELVSKYIFDKESLGANILKNQKISNFLLNADSLKLLEEQEYQTVLDTSNLIAEALLARPTVLVSHSQGNLFANSISSELLVNPLIAEKARSKFANLQVATPAATIIAPISDYYTHPKDRIIVRALNQFGGFPIKTPNFGLYDPQYVGSVINENINLNDPTYHFMYDTYMSKNMYGSFNNEWIDVTEKTHIEYNGNSGVEVLDGYLSVKNEFVHVTSITSLNDSRFSTMENIFYEKLNNLAKKVTAETTPDCNADGIENDLAYFNEYGGIISLDSEVIEGAVVENGARVCNNSKIQNVNAFISGPRVVMEEYTVGSKCEFAGFTAEGVVTENSDGAILNKVSFHRNGACNNDGIEESKYVNVIFSANEQSYYIHNTSIDGTVYIGDSSIINSDLDGGSDSIFPLNIQKSTVSDARLYGTQYINLSEIENYNMIGKKEILYLDDGTENILSLQGGTIKSSGTRKTIEGLCLVRGKIFDTNLKCYDPIVAREGLGNRLVTHINLGAEIYGGTNSYLEGLFTINGRVENSTLIGAYSYKDETKEVFYDVGVYGGSNVKNVTATGYFLIGGVLEGQTIHNQTAINGVIKDYEF